jgi:hypothetical protein
MPSSKKYSINRLDRFTVLYKEIDLEVIYSVEALANGDGIAVYKTDTEIIKGKLDEPELVFELVVKYLKNDYKNIEIV